MRKAIIPILLVLSLATVLAVPATAAKPDTRLVVPLDFVKEVPGNPCTGTAPTYVHVVGEWELHALPSVDSFFAGDFKHAWGKFTTANYESPDGYVSPEKLVTTAVINQRQGETDHVVYSERRNVMFEGPDGGKYRVHEVLSTTFVDGELRSNIEILDATCIRWPTS